MQSIGRITDLEELFSALNAVTWLPDVNCRDTPLSKFFVEAGTVIDEDTLHGCRTCPVRRECLIWAYDRGLSRGYFAGVSAGQRDRMTKEEALEYIENDPPDPNYVPLAARPQMDFEEPDAADTGGAPGQDTSGDNDE